MVRRRANREDGCKGRFGERRFKCQVLLDEADCLAVITDVAFNPTGVGVAQKRCWMSGLLLLLCKVGVWLMTGTSETAWKYIGNHDGWEIR